MPDSAEGQGAPGLGELSRQVRDVLVRFEGLAARLETQFVRSDIFILYKENLDRELRRLARVVDDIEDKMDKMPSADKLDKLATVESVKTLEGRVGWLEDNLKWIVRLVLGFVVMGILAAVIVFGKPAGSP